MKIYTLYWMLAYAVITPEIAKKWDKGEPALPEIRYEEKEIKLNDSARAYDLYHYALSECQCDTVLEYRKNGTIIKVRLDSIIN